MDDSGTERCERCEELAGRVAELEQQLAALRDELAKSKKNSATSSRPRSSDITNPPPKRKKPGRRKKRKIGGQRGHKRHQRAAFPKDQVDWILEYRYEACPCCGGTLQDRGLEPKKQQTVEIVGHPLEVTEHHRRGPWCADCGNTHHCPLPDDILHAGLVGPRRTALIGWLKGVCHMSVGNLRKYRRDVIGVRLSRGMVQKLVDNFSQCYVF